jgi:hypothetical protein
MASSKPSSDAAARPAAHMTKKCPWCFTYLNLSDRTCHACGKKVGAVNKLGLATKPTDYRGYAVAAVCILVAAIFFWWAFFMAE